MKYAVLSDSHDNTEALDAALAEIGKRGITAGFHLGDFTSPEFISALLEYENITWYSVWGNMDDERTRSQVALVMNSQFNIIDEPCRELQIDGKTVFLTHFPFIAEKAAESGSYHAVFHGHTHQKRMEKDFIGTLIANPGELSGLRYGTSSFGIWDSDTNDFEFIDLSKLA